MTLALYDLAGADDALRFSPYCWRTKLALKHKGLAFETVPWRFTDKQRIARTGQDKVPVLVDGDAWICDSWAIALHLDAAYPDRPALMPDDTARTAAHFVQCWADLTLHPAIRPLVLADIHAVIHDEDKAYFRESRERSVGMPLETYSADPAAARTGLEAALAPLEQHLAAVGHVSGAAPAYADYIVLGSLQWLNAIRGDPCLDNLPGVQSWFARMGELFDGYVRDAPTAARAA